MAKQKKRARKSGFQKHMEKNVLTRFDYLDMRLVKLSVAAAMLTLVSGITAFGNWVMSVHWIWFFIATVVFAIRPFRRAYCGKC